MFRIQHKSKNGFEVVVLEDEETKCYAEVIPACGATLHAFGIKDAIRDLQVIEHYESREQFDHEVEALGYRSCKLSPFVCRLENGSYRFGNQDLQLDTGPQKHALHGLLYKKNFTLISEEANEMHASVTMKYSYQADDAGYPFFYDCLVTYQLAADCKLHLRTECVNRSDGLMPLQDGWHPYFHLGKTINELELEFQSLEKFVFDAELLPTGERVPYQEFSSIKPIGDAHFDNAFTLDGQECQPLCVLRNAEAGVEIRVYPERSYPVLQIYTPDSRSSVAIENLSGPPNAFNLGAGFITLQAGESSVFETAYQIHLLNKT